MKLNNTESIKPLKDMVLVNIITKDYKEGELIIDGEDAKKSGEEVKMYFGDVISMGPDAINPNQCPNLSIGDTALFSQFAGHHVSTRETKLVKIIRGYDIMATLEDINNITNSNIHPTADRLLVSVFYRDDTEDSLVLDGDELRDPTLADLDYGVVLKKGPACKTDINVGDRVAFTPYVGERVAKQPEENVAEYRVLNELDALFTL